MYYTFSAMKENPFPITSYQGPRYFCDREAETDQLREALMNGRNITLFSPRRMGKTGLIHHLFNSLKEEKCNTCYIDIFGTEDMNGFLNRLANAVLSSISTKKENIISKALETFGKLRPQISYNSLSGIPQISFTLQNEAEKQATLDEIFDILESQKRPNYIAIDEFQQISKYPEKNTEQLLRSYIQHLKKTFFVFSGSQRHLLTPMFSDPKRAFYQSSGFLALNKLEYDIYKSFIIQQFETNKQKISPEVVDFILDWTKSYTFYTQYLCNRIFSKGKGRIDEELTKTTIGEIFAERETVFYNYRNLLSPHQYQLLAAIAMEDKVSEPTGQAFMKKHDLSNASTIRKNLLALIDKEMIYETPSKDKPVYEVYDVFLSRWFQWL